MPREATVTALARSGDVETSIVRSHATVYRPQGHDDGGAVCVNPAFVAPFAELGLDSPAGFLDLPGEVVSGHPDRHVLRVGLPGFERAFYLKRQHVVRWKEKWRNWRSGFGWVSRCEREAAILRRLTAKGLPCPRWAAAGTDGRGRAFLLVEEIADAIDLRLALSDSAMSLNSRRSLARDLGRTIAAYHNAGFTTPELSAKHVLVSSSALRIACIDWQTSRHATAVPLAERIHALAALHASVAESLASPRQRLVVLREAVHWHDGNMTRERVSAIARQVIAESNRIANRRSIRDQRHAPAAANQRLVWVAGEAVCAVPEVAAIWPSPAVTAPFYGERPGTVPFALTDGTQAVLVRGRSFAPLARFRAWLGGRPWRSPGVTIGRVLFHLERYGIPGPQLLAFGQRLTGRAGAEWFALASLPAEPIAEVASLDVAHQLGQRLRQLHDAGCRVIGDPLAAFGCRAGSVSVRDPLQIRIARADAVCELRRLVAALPPALRPAVEAGYATAATMRKQV